MCGGGEGEKLRMGRMDHYFEKHELGFGWIEACHILGYMQVGPDLFIGISRTRWD